MEPTARGPLCLGAFTQPDVFKGHPCGGLCQVACGLSFDGQIAFTVQMRRSLGLFRVFGCSECAAMNTCVRGVCGRTFSPGHVSSVGSLG